MIIPADPSAAIVHFGVKGMRWGVRKAHPSYSHDQQLADRKAFGRGGAKRINKRLNKGQTHEVAVRKEKRLRTTKRVLLAAYGLSVAVNVLAQFGPSILSSVAARAATKRGEAAILGIGMWKPIVAKSAGGAFKITTLK